MMTKLAELATGQTGTVVGFSKGGKLYRQKLMAMGLTKGTPFNITRLAPMGDPVEIEVRGFSLSLRKTEAEALIVESGS
jgi:ferrous iron transport protein A